MATPDRWTPAQAALALYGALDDAVTSTGSAEIEATVSRYLPGSTGPNAGWYEQLLVFLGHREAPFTARTSVPSLGQALTVLQQHAAAPVPEKQSQARPTSEKGAGKLAVGSAGVKKAAKKAAGSTGAKKAAKKAAAGDASEPRPLSTVQKARIVFAIGTLSQLPGWYLRGTLGDSWAEQLSDALGVAGGRDGSELLDFLRLHLNDRAGYSKVVELAAKQGLINLDVALVPLCQPKLMTVRGFPCLVITTEFEREDVSLNDLKDVIDPQNWAKCLSTFFCQMDGKADREDGWSRALEQVSTTCWIEKTHMKTPLRYWKSEDQDAQQPPTACLDYALDDKPPDDAKGDGLIVVDEGFIRMTSTAGDSTKGGARVRTRKVVGFRNSALTPWGVLACSMGYGDQGIDMLIDGVERRKAESGKGWIDWKASTPPPPTKAPTDPKDTPPQSTPPVDTDASRRAVELAVEMVNEYIDDMSEKGAAIAAKWASGVVPIAETMTFSADLAARLTIDPWRYLERLRYPGQGGDK
jgi:hypothetical protein